jgi:hypothetical protein
MNAAAATAGTVSALPTPPAVALPGAGKEET